ncbi:MAG: hypothetical protein IPI59_09105 [Sphingobacteriales bacterium]|jgi:hypothetical protein|nr:hypothetical protein [Sphingobacteriales bacterium]MBP9141831.1 hypothetical protein [Chitinophagales bacterium]MDA0199530.1 hypothetical protein [Bacteroidota bacterium]MBK6889793.1 hypothetical protein [Sphingobacteriales bacterium]MBK7527691.1 hypothetical protein [Sphingobacteriales bacterium]
MKSRFSGSNSPTGHNNSVEGSDARTQQGTKAVVHATIVTQAVLTKQKRHAPSSRKNSFKQFLANNYTRKHCNNDVVDFIKRSIIDAANIDVIDPIN